MNKDRQNWVIICIYLFILVLGGWGVTYDKCGVDLSIVKGGGLHA